MRSDSVPRRITLAIWTVQLVQAYDMVPRWGHAAVFTSNPPSLLIQGGKTTSEAGQTYSSAPNSADFIRLPLSSSFKADAPPYELLDAAAPPYAWHTLSPLDKDGAGLLSFGGDGGSSTPLPAGTDSAWIYNSSAFTQEPSGWGNQPARVIHHSAAASDGKVYITGGQRNDGSGRILADSYLFDGSGFTSLPALPSGVSDHISAILPNGTLVVLGGIQTDPATGNPALAPLNTLHALDEGAEAWRTVLLSGDVPESRRGAIGISDRGDRLIIMGGANIASDQAMGDIWRLDMANPAWSKIDMAQGAPSARYDFTVTPVGDGKVIIFGGYGADGPASPELFIYNIATNAWSKSFDPPSAPTTSGSGTPSTASPDPSPSNGSSPNTSGNSSEGSHTGSSRPSNPESSDTPTSEPSLGVSMPHNLSTGAQIGMAVGIISGVSLLAILAFLCLRRRRRRHIYKSAILNEKGQGDDSQGLVADWSEKSGIVGLGLGAVSAGWTRISPQRRQDPYATLQDEGMYTSPPATKSTRRIGNGVRLTGPRPPPSRRDMLSDEDSRCFKDTKPIKEEEEDWTVDRKTRGSWAPAGRVLRSSTSASSTSDIDSDGESLLPVPRIAGGPVPTPMASASIIDPFDDSASVDIGTIRSTHSYQSVRSSSSQRYRTGPGLHQLPTSEPIDFTDLLAVPTTRWSYAQSSLPRSMSSRGSTYLSGSDAEEGNVQYAERSTAQYAAAILISPDPDEGQPVKRSESFFKRMTQGGIAGLLGGQTAGGGYAKARGAGSGMDIRDWEKGEKPSLWPVESRDEPIHSRSGTDQSGPSAESKHTNETGNKALVPPPSAWTGAGRANMAEQSVPSLASARTMRDMVLVQRDVSESSQYAASGHRAESSTGSDRSEGMAKTVWTKRNAVPTSTTVPEPSSHEREESEDIIAFTNPSTPEPFSIPFPKSSDPVPAPVAPPVEQPIISVTSHFSPLAAAAAASEELDTTPKKPTRAPSPPNGSPLAKAIISHRRPVRDMVFSINKRSSAHFGHDSTASSSAHSSPTTGGSRAKGREADEGDMLFSPASQYSAASPGSSPMMPTAQAGAKVPSKQQGREGEQRKGVSWEVRRKESLVVANPDRK